MKFLRYCLIASGLGLLTFSAPAMAQDASATGDGTYGQLSALSNQIAILKAQAQIAQLQEEIANAKRNLGNSTSMTTRPPAYLPGMPTVSAAEPDNRYIGPHILAISGHGGRLNALLLMPEGATIQARPGTTLENGMVVQSVSPASVTVIENGRLFALPFAGTTVNDTIPAPNG